MHMQVKRNNIFIAIFSILIMFSMLYIDTCLCYIDNGRYIADKITNLATPIKPACDKNYYKAIQLKNGIKVLLISNPKAMESYLSINVNAGSTQDPDDGLGLAHFLEHMLFLGTDKYPTPNSFMDFISTNNGSHNAVTRSDGTTYYLKINSASLEQAVDRISQFFISPMLDKKYIDKERNAVNSEHEKNIKNDGWILHETMQLTANPHNPENRFSTGDLTTLHNKDDKLHKKLVDFFNTYYVGNNIDIAIYSNKGLTKLENLVHKYFKTVKPGKKNIKNNSLYVTKAETAKIIQVKTITDINFLVLDFYIPFDYQNIKTPVFGYIYSFLNTNFIIPLKDQGLITYTSVEHSINQNNYANYTVNIELTDKGKIQKEKILVNFFEVLNYIKKVGMQDYIVKEIQKTDKQKSNFMKEQTSLSDVIGYSRNMSKFPLKDILYYDYDDLDSKLLNHVLNSLTWKNLRIFIASNDAETDTKIPFYTSTYKANCISAKFITQLENPLTKSYFSIPKPNNFIADDLNIKSKPNYNIPKNITDERGIKSWYMPDNKFTLPLGEINVLLSNSKATQSVTDSILISMYAYFIQESFIKTEYIANIAGMSTNMSSNDKGLEFTIAGFQDKQADLMTNYINHIKKPTITNTTFNSCKQLIIKNLENKKFQPPYLMSIDKFEEILYPSTYSTEEILQAVKKLEYKDLAKFIKNFYRQIHIEMLIYGNYTEAEAQKITNKIKNNFVTAENSINKVIITNRNITKKLIFSDVVDNNNSCCTNFYSIKSRLSRANALSILTSTMLKSQFFYQLRTEEQIGYVVFNNLYNLSLKPWLYFSVQSSVKNPEYIYNRINSFLESQVLTIKKMSFAKFQQNKNSVVNLFSKRNLSFSVVSQNFWSLIKNQNADFYYYHKLISQIKNIHKRDIVKFIKILQNDSSSVSIQLWSTNDSQYKKSADKRYNSCDSIKCFKNLPLIKGK